MTSPKPADPCIALLDSADFIRAKKLVEDFDQWETFEDYLDDREGLRMGLAFAGRSIELAPISLDLFLAWCRATGGRVNAVRLDEFAALMEAMRRVPCAEVRPRLEDRANDGHHGGSFISVLVDVQAYEAWVACLRERPSPALLEAYARFSVESWSDAPESAVGNARRCGESARLARRD